MKYCNKTNNSFQLTPQQSHTGVCCTWRKPSVSDIHWQSCQSEFKSSKSTCGTTHFWGNSSLTFVKDGLLQRLVAVHGDVISTSVGTHYIVTLQSTLCSESSWISNPQQQLLIFPIIEIKIIILKELK